MQSGTEQQDGQDQSQMPDAERPLQQPDEGERSFKPEDQDEAEEEAEGVVRESDDIEGGNTGPTARRDQ